MSNTGADSGKTCPCCLRWDRWLTSNIHLHCWTEHHSDPTEDWPPDHDCQFGVLDDAGVSK